MRPPPASRFARRTHRRSCSKSGAASPGVVPAAPDAWISALRRYGTRRFADVAADPRRALIRRAMHLTNLDQPDRFTEVIRRFATRIEA